MFCGGSGVKPAFEYDGIARLLHPDGGLIWLLAAWVAFIAALLVTAYWRQTLAAIGLTLATIDEVFRPTTHGSAPTFHREGAPSQTNHTPNERNAA